MINQKLIPGIEITLVWLVIIIVFKLKHNLSIYFVRYFFKKSYHNGFDAME